MKIIKITETPQDGFRPVQHPRANAPRCRRCPKWKGGWCNTIGMFVSGEAGMCEYGRRKNKSACQLRYLERKTRADAAATADFGSSGPSSPSGQPGSSGSSSSSGLSSSSGSSC